MTTQRQTIPARQATPARPAVRPPNGVVPQASMGTSQPLIMMGLDELNAASTREFILIGGGDGTGKSTGLISLVRFINASQPDARIFVIDTEYGWVKIIQRQFRGKLANLTYYACSDIDQVLEALDRIRQGTLGDMGIAAGLRHPPMKAGDWVFVESMAKIWDLCLPYGSMLTLKDGSRISIGEVVEKRLTPEVLGYNHLTGQVEARKVVGHFKTPLTEDLYQVGDAVVTANHPVFTQENGYIRADEAALASGGLTMGELDDQDVHRREDTDPASGKCPSRGVTWRRIRPEVVWASGKRSCQICSEREAVGVPLVEVRGPKGLGFSPTRVNTGVFRGGFTSQPTRQGGGEEALALPIHDPLSSGVHSRGEPAGVAGAAAVSGEGNDPPRAGSLVHGRRRFPSEERDSNPQYPFLALRVGSGSLRLLHDRWNTCPPLSGQQVQRTRLGLGSVYYGQQILAEVQGVGGAVHSSISELQGREGKEACTSLPGNRAETQNVLSMWEGVHSGQINRDLLSGVPQGRSAERGEEVVLAQRGDEAHKPSGICEEAPGVRCPSGVHDRIHEAAASGFVYDIEVEGNHDFFADGLLVHNSQQHAYLMVAQKKKAEYLGRNERGERIIKGGPIPHPDQFWNVAKAVHDDRFVNVLLHDLAGKPGTPAVNVVMTTRKAKDRDPGGFIRENRDRAAFKVEMGIEAAFEGAPRLPYEPDTVLYLDKAGGTVKCRVLKDRGATSQAEFPVSDPAEWPYLFFWLYREGMSQEDYQMALELATG